MVAVGVISKGVPVPITVLLGSLASVQVTSYRLLEAVIANFVLLSDKQTLGLLTFAIGNAAVEPVVIEIFLSTVVQ